MGEERTLFGTDGIRGVANVEPMTSEVALRLGGAVAHVFHKGRRRGKILIGKDTRLSGYMLETAMASGICSMGVDAVFLGPLPTPGIAFLTRSLRADAGAVISASHNPFQDNGIKFFAHDGFKLPDEVELEIERLVLGDGLGDLRPDASDIGKAYRLEDSAGRYNVFVKNTFPRHLTLEGVRIAIDCANGAAYRVAPEVLYELGASVLPFGTDPDGENINDGCGALYPEGLSSRILSAGCQIGIALDGDADRCILIDETGSVVDGDEILAIVAKELIGTGMLARNTIVSTVMSNLGLEVCLREMGGTMVRTPVGDRYVVEEMLRGGFNVGGEQSGHLVFLDHTTTGDGLISALLVLAIMVERQRPLSDLRKVMARFPQVLVNVPVREKRDVSDLPSVSTAVRAAEEALGDRGRVVVRYSGTELLARVMIEGENQDGIQALAEDIAGAFELEVGRLATE